MEWWSRWIGLASIIDCCELGSAGAVAATCYFLTPLVYLKAEIYYLDYMAFAVPRTFNIYQPVHFSLANITKY